MPELRAGAQKNGAMSKVKSKKRNVEEDEEKLFTTDGGHLDDRDEGDDDLSDSEESVFSGLEDSGSDDESGDDDEEAEEINLAEEADVNENGKSVSEADRSETSGKHQDQKDKNRKPQKEKQVAETEGKRVKSSGSAQVDEYDQDTSDEE
ncbi:hypothetical protein QTP70_028655, partial [Hemibagrus guttatus]